MSNKISISEGFNEKVTQKVRDVFLDLLPEDAFTDLVNKEVSAFFEESAEFTITKGNNGGYNRPSTPDTIGGKVSPFRLIVWEAVNKMVRDKIQAHLHSDKFRTDVTYNEFGQQQVEELNEFMDAKLEHFAMGMAKNMFKDLFASAIEQSKMTTMNEVNNALAQRGI